MDKISLHGMKFYSHSGIHSFEKDVGQLFEIDVECYLELKKASVSDHISNTIDYSFLFAVVKKVMESCSFNLMERLAGEIAKQTLDMLPISKVTVRCRKPRVPVKGFIEYAEVEITRTAKDFA